MVKGNRKQGRGRGRGRGLPVPPRWGQTSWLDGTPSHARFQNASPGGTRAVQTPERPRSTDGFRRRGLAQSFVPRALLMHRTLPPSRNARTAAPSNQSVPLSSLLYSERPLLRPVIFVRSTQTPLLFQGEEDIFQPNTTEHDKAEEDSMPTANYVASLFSGQSHEPPGPPPPPTNNELEEVGFPDMARLCEDLDATSAVDNEVTFPHVDTDTTAMLVSSTSDIETRQDTTLESDDDDEQIVYVAPYPKIGRLAHFTPPLTAQEGAGLQNMSIAAKTELAAAAPVEVSAPSQLPPNSPSATMPKQERRSSPPVPFKFSFVPAAAPKQPRTTPSAKAKLKAREKRRKAARAKKAKNALFKTFPAILEEENLRSGKATDRDPRWQERRRGGSDLDWGENSDDPDVNAEGMSVDVDVDLEAMAAFLKGMGGGNPITIDDLEDRARMRQEDSEQTCSSETSDGEEEDHIFKLQEPLIIGESRDEDSVDTSSESSESDYDGVTHLGLRKTSEQVRLYVMSRAGRSSGSLKNTSKSSSRRGKSGEAGPHHGFYERNSKVGRNHKFQQQSFFRQDPFPVRRLEFETKKGMRKGGEILGYRRNGPKTVEDRRVRYRETREANVGGARLEKPEVHVDKRATDIAALLTSIRTFAADPGGRSTMELPPMKTDIRKAVHEIAFAFRLKSKSFGSGDKRHTTLTKTTKTMLAIDDWAVAKILRRMSAATGDSQNRHGGSGARRHRDGEKVGKAAPRIGESNVGFRMLASMGWSEGDRIGVTGGLTDPIAAVFKHSKLGLGAK